MSEIELAVQLPWVQTDVVSGSFEQDSHHAQENYDEKKAWIRKTELLVVEYGWEDITMTYVIWKCEILKVDFLSKWVTAQVESWGGSL